MPGNLAARGRPFEPKERKTKRIASILNDYLEGPVILRELIQNAEDAGATEVFFVLDVRSQPREKLISPGLRKFAGPALLAGNNAVFNEDDYKSLSNIGDSVKKEDITKTGKFGVGFLSVYHWTDSPCFISGNSFVILEPHGRSDTLDGREVHSTKISRSLTTARSFDSHYERRSMPQNRRLNVTRPIPNTF
ncbi:hypothetical protein BC832DRAFT_107492 [Gaertneriomyces semiglobifer]|nr:hypothetical protein BC832DRAFT_107492 [Gaertneriomyces semiglobifer]